MLAQLEEHVSDTMLRYLPMIDRWMPFDRLFGNSSATKDSSSASGCFTAAADATDAIVVFEGRWAHGRLGSGEVAPGTKAEGERGGRARPLGARNGEQKPMSAPPMDCKTSNLCPPPLRHQPTPAGLELTGTHGGGCPPLPLPSTHAARQASVLAELGVGVAA